MTNDELRAIVGGPTLLSESQIQDIRFRLEQGMVPKSKFDALCEELVATKGELRLAQEQLHMVRTPSENVWFWEDKGDEPESLSCPVVMSADTLRDFVAAKDQLRDLDRALTVCVVCEGVLEVAVTPLHCEGVCGHCLENAESVDNPNIEEAEVVERAEATRRTFRQLGDRRDNHLRKSSTEAVTPPHYSVLTMLQLVLDFGSDTSLSQCIAEIARLKQLEVDSGKTSEGKLSSVKG